MTRHTRLKAAAATLGARWMCLIDALLSRKPSRPYPNGLLPIYSPLPLNNEHAPSGVNTALANATPAPTTLKSASWKGSSTGTGLRPCGIMGHHRAFLVERRTYELQTGGHEAQRRDSQVERRGSDAQSCTCEARTCISLRPRRGYEAQMRSYKRSDAQL
jgi:hypothetical protein